MLLCLFSEKYWYKMYFIIKYYSGGFMNYVYKFIEKLNINNQTIVAAISGGPDSMLLLDILL